MALLAAATAAAFGRVFSGARVTGTLFLVGLLSATVAVLLERRSLVVAALVSTGLLLLAVGMIVFGETTWFGLPTLDTLREIANSAGAVGEQARVQVAPTAPIEPLLLAAVTAVWAAVFSSHSLAFRAGSPLLALLPPVALVTFADTVLEGSVKPLYGLFFLLAGLAVVFTDGLHRIQGWGPVWGGRGSEGRLVRAAARSARRVTVAAIGVAAVAPILVPGFGSKGLVDLSSVAAGDGALSPLVSIGAELRRSEAVEVFRVVSPLPTYHRMIALTRFDGSAWQPPSGLEETSPIGRDDVIVPAGLAGGKPIEQSYRVSGGTRYLSLPVAYAPVAVEIDQDLRLDVATTTIWLDRFLDQGDSYTARSLLAQPLPADLDLVRFPPTPPTDPAVRLPTGLSPRIGDIAERWTAEAPSTYRAILAIQDRLRDPARFTYSTDVPDRDDSFTILDFLTRSREGFCQQFATAMAVMLRTLGIPARVAVGFTQGTRVRGKDDTYRVTTDNYHAWVEVRFPGYGWLAFEPTPTRANPAAAAYLSPAEPCTPGPGGACGPGGAQDPRLNEPVGAPNGLPAYLSRLIRDELRQAATAATGRPVPPDRPFRITPRTTLAAAALVALLILGAIPPVRLARRRRRLRRARREPRALILATYGVFTERAGDLGLVRGRAETPEEYRRRVVAGGLLSDGHLDRLTALTIAAAYGPLELRQEEVATAREAAATALRELRRGTPVARRIAGLYRRAD